MEVFASYGFGHAAGGAGQRRPSCRGRRWRRSSFHIAKGELHKHLRRQTGRESRTKSVSIPSLRNGLFDTPKQGAQRGSDDLRLFKPGKLGKSLQNLPVGLSQPDRGLLQIRQMPHDNRAVAIEMPNCVAYVWRRAESGAEFGLWYVGSTDSSQKSSTLNAFIGGVAYPHPSKFGLSGK